MTTYRVDIDGKTVWTGTAESEDTNVFDVFPREYSDRPPDPAPGEPFPPAHDLYVDDEHIGHQVSLAEENGV